MVEPLIVPRSEHPISRRLIDPHVVRILYRLIAANHVAYLVGGGVRDLMLERRPKDFDVGTSAHPHEVRDLFRNSRLIGRRFRLVHVFFGQQNIEVATFRRHTEDTAEGDDPMIRRDNTFGTPAEDAFRRDFTVNALFYDPNTFQVIDYVGGVADLRARLIRTVGDPSLRMREDPVRMVRAVRFAAKLGFELEPATRAAIVRHGGDLAKASTPRLVEEVFKILSAPGSGVAIALLQELGLLRIMLPVLADQLASQPAGAERNAAASANRTVRNLVSLEQRLGDGEPPSRALMLACLCADLQLSRSMPTAAARDTAMIEGLRSRGFSRAEIERAGLLLQALNHLLTLSPRTRRLARRPYFDEARLLFEIIAPVYGVETAALDRFLAAPRRAAVPVAQPPADGANGAPLARGRRRRRRRRPHASLPAAAATNAGAAPALVAAAADDGPPAGPRPAGLGPAGDHRDAAPAPHATLDGPACNGPTGGGPTLDRPAGNGPTCSS